MASTKDIDMFLCFKPETPKEIIDYLKNFTINNEYDETVKLLCNDYRHACGVPVIDFYKASERLGKYRVDDGVYYLRYCNVIKDYDNYFEKWLTSIAPWIIMINAHHVGTIYDSDREKMKLISIKNDKLVFIPCVFK